jgi:hypothetical protein
MISCCIEITESKNEIVFNSCWRYVDRFAFHFPSISNFIGQCLVGTCLYSPTCLRRTINVDHHVIPTPA